MLIRKTILLTCLVLLKYVVFCQPIQCKILTASYFQTSENFRLSQVVNYFNTQNTKSINDNFINAGLVTKYLWIHYKIQLPNDKNDYCLILDNSRLNKIKVYFVASQTILDSVITGDYYNFETRRLLYPNFRFLLPKNNDSIIDAYFYVDHRGSTLQLPIQLQSKNNFAHNDRDVLIFVGLKMGIFIIPFFFGIFLFSSTRNKIYLLYATYVFISATWLWSTDGYGFQYMWQWYPQINNRLEASFGVLYSGIFAAYALQFTKQYQSGKSVLRNTLKLLMYFFFFWGIIPLFPFISIDYNPSTPIFLYLFFLTNIIGALVAFCYLINLVKTNGKPIVFYLFAVGNTIVFSVFVVLYNLGYVNLSVSSSTLVGIGMIIDVVFMTLGLAYQFNQYKLDKEKMLIDYIAQEKSINATIINAQEQERKRISREMHDDIGAGLTRITLMSEAAKNKQDNANELNEIAITGRKIVGNLSEIIWSMQPDNNNLEQLFSYIREQLNELLEYTNIEYGISFQNTEINQKISSTLARNIVMVSKEIVNNAVKYSSCHQLIYEAIIKNNTIILQISDNGIGFDSIQKNKGNGLSNIETRIKEIDGNLQLVSNKNGTIYNIEIPIH